MAIRLPHVMYLVLKKYMPDDVTLSKVTRVDDPDWGMPTYTMDDYVVRASTFPITLEDMSFLPPGIVTEGDIYLMFLGWYDVGGGVTIVPEKGDRITIDNIEYEIRVMSAILHGDIVVTRTAYGRRLNR